MDKRLIARINMACTRAACLTSELELTRRQLEAIRRTSVWHMFELFMTRLERYPRLLHVLRTCLRHARHIRGGLVAQNDVSELLASPYFDAAWYAARYSGVPRDPTAAAVSYLAYSGAAARDPGPEFDSEWYMAENPDVGTSNPLLHYLRVGCKRLRAPNPAARKQTRGARAQALGLDLPVPQLRFAIGFAGHAEDAALMRLVRSAQLSAAQAGVAACCEILCLAPPGAILPEGARGIPIAEEASAPAMHNRLMCEAAKSGAILYVAAESGGIFDPGCITALLRMSAAQAHRALIAASAFPQENPKTFDMESFDTGWAAGECLLVPLAIVQDIGGLDPELTRYWDVDVSWRARQAGYGVKTCPSALFHTKQTAADWIDDEALTSGYRLAWLWEHQPAQAEIRAEISRHGGTSPLLGDRPPERRDREIADFEHGFGFAPARW